MAVPERSYRRTTETRRKRADANRPTKPVSVRRTSRSAKPGEAPVMARTTTYGDAQKTKPRRKVKRRFDVLVDSQGAEVRLPAIPRFNLDWRLLSVGLLAVLGFALYQVLTMPMFRVQSVQVNGLEHVTPAQIEQTLNLDGKLIFSLNPEQIKESLMSTYPELSHVDVSVNIPSDIEITVTERTPVLIWRMAGKSNLVDQGGMPFTLRENFPVIDLPVVHAEEFVTDQAVPELTEEDLTLLEQVFGQLPPELLVKPGAQPLISPKTVSAVLQLHEVAPLGVKLVYTTQHGLGWQEQDGRYVYFGNEDEIIMKYAVYESMLKNLKAEKIQPAYISVEHVHAPYYRLAD